MSRVIVITGAAGALGTALCRHLVARGYSVAGVGLRRHEGRLRTLEKDLGATFAGFPLEEDSIATWDAALGVIESRLGPISGAALVAGGWRGGRPFHEDRDERAPGGACWTRTSSRPSAHFARSCLGSWRGARGAWW